MRFPLAALLVLGCKSDPPATSTPPPSSEVAKITIEAKARAAKQHHLLTAAIPATTPTGKAYLTALRDNAKATCACPDVACFNALVDPAEPTNDEMTEAEHAYAFELIVLGADCGTALTSAAIERLMDRK